MHDPSAETLWGFTLCTSDGTHSPHKTTILLKGPRVLNPWPILKLLFISKATGREKGHGPLY